MRTFVLRARAAPTDSQKLLAAIGQEAHPEILAHTLMNAIFVAQSHRPDVMVYLVLESTQDYSRTVRLEANAMHAIGGFDERALLGKVAAALDASRGLGKEESRPVESGVTVRTVSFERLVEASGVALKKAGEDMLGRCPFHDDAEASLVVTSAKNLWHCFGCRIGGDPIDWVTKSRGVSFRHASACKSACSARLIASPRRKKASLEKHFLTFSADYARWYWI